jgi:hypothetical protein
VKRNRPFKIVVDPAQFEKMPGPGWSYTPSGRGADERNPENYGEFDPERDFIVIFGCQPFIPGNSLDDGPGVPRGRECGSCGRAHGQRIHRHRAILDEYGRTLAKAIAGRIVCADCCRASLDDTGMRYWGLPVGSAMDPLYPVDQPAYVPDAELAGGKGETKMTRKVRRAAARAKEKVKA